MALDVYVQPQPELPRIGSKYSRICSFEDDGYYWFLYPLFEELAKETGQHIDLYDGAAFSGISLEALARTIASARHRKCRTGRA